MEKKNPDSRKTADLTSVRPPDIDPMKSQKLSTISQKTAHGSLTSSIMPKSNDMGEIRRGRWGRDGREGEGPVMGNRPGWCHRRTPCRSTCRAACAWDTRPCCAGTVVGASSSRRTCSHSRRSPGDRRPGGSVGKHRGPVSRGFMHELVLVLLLTFLLPLLLLLLYFIYNR